jgi:hypothetical protein
MEAKVKANVPAANARRLDRNRLEPFWLMDKTPFLRFVFGHYRVCGGAVLPPGGRASPGLPPGLGTCCNVPGICSGLMPGSLPLIACPSETQLDSLQQEISPVAASHMNEKDPPCACALSAMFRQAWAPEGFLAAS